MLKNTHFKMKKKYILIYNLFNVEFFLNQIICIGYRQLELSGHSSKFYFLYIAFIWI